jgi:hypothetical protein
MVYVWTGVSNIYWFVQYSLKSDCHLTLSWSRRYEKAPLGNFLKVFKWLEMCVAKLLNVGKLKNYSKQRFEATFLKFSKSNFVLRLSGTGIEKISVADP